MSVVALVAVVERTERSEDKKSMLSAALFGTRSYQGGSDTGLPYPIKARCRDQLRYEDLSNLSQTPAVAKKKQPSQAPFPTPPAQPHREARGASDWISGLRCNLT